MTQTHAYYIVIFFFFSSPNSVFHDARVSLSLSLGGNSHKCTPTIINPAYLLSIHPLNPNFTYSSKKKVKMLLALPDGIIDILYLFQSFHVLFLRERTNTICTTQPCFFFFIHFLSNQSDVVYHQHHQIMGIIKEKRKEEKKMSILQLITTVTKYRNTNCLTNDIYRSHCISSFSSSLSNLLYIFSFLIHC